MAASMTGERARLVRRNTILLAIAQGCVQTTFPVMLVIGGPAASHLTGRDSAAGLLWGLYFLAAAGGAAAIGRWMDRVGRRPGLLLAYALVGMAAAAAANCRSAMAKSPRAYAALPASLASAGVWACAHPTAGDTRSSTATRTKTARLTTHPSVRSRRDS